MAFEELSPEEANAWLDEHGQEASAEEPMTLASLYAIVEGWEAVEARQATGFS